MEIEDVRLLDIRPLKKYAREHMREDSMLRNVLLKEPDKVTPAAYLAKMQTWFLVLHADNDKM